MVAIIIGLNRRNEMQTHLGPFLIIEIVTDQGMQINTVPDRSPIKSLSMDFPSDHCARS